MDMKEFFDLPHDQREMLVSIHRKQKRIRMDKATITGEMGRLETMLLNLQIECDHPFVEKVYKAHENEYGNFTGGGTYRCYCDDCGMRWTEDKEKK